MQTRQSKKAWTRALLLAITLPSILTACATTTTVSSAPTSPDRVACAVFQPIYWSARDTQKSVEQIKEHNAVGKAVCGWGAGK